MIKSWERFQKKSLDMNSVQRGAQLVIEKSLSSTEILHVRRDTMIKTNFVFDTYKGENNEATSYTYFEDDVKIGDYLFLPQYDKYYLVFHQNHAIASDAYYKKMRVLECNGQFTINGEIVRGCLITSARKMLKLDEFTESMYATMFRDKAMLVIPSKYSVAYNDNLLICGKQYKVIDFDNIANEGISYISLAHVLNTLTEKVPEPSAPTDDAVNILKAGFEYILPTEEGYFESTPDVTILERTADQVTIKIPYDITDLEIKVKQRYNVVTSTYKVGV